MDNPRACWEVENPMRRTPFWPLPKRFDSRELLLPPPSATFAPSNFPVTQAISFVAQHKCVQRFKVKVTTCLNPTDAVVEWKRSEGNWNPLTGCSLNPLHLWQRDQWEVFAMERADEFSLPPFAETFPLMSFAVAKDDVSCATAPCSELLSSVVFLEILAKSWSG